MNYDVISMVIVLVIVSAMWMYNAAVLSNRRMKEIDDLYKRLFAANNTESKAKIRVEIAHISEFDMWSWQFCSVLWLFIMGFIVVYRLFLRG